MIIGIGKGKKNLTHFKRNTDFMENRLLESKGRKAGNPIWKLLQ